MIILSQNANFEHEAQLPIKDHENNLLWKNSNKKKKKTKKYCSQIVYFINKVISSDSFLCNFICLA